MSIPKPFLRKRRSRLPRFLALMVLPFALLLVWLLKSKPRLQKSTPVEADIPLPPEEDSHPEPAIPAAPKGTAKSRPVKTTVPVEPADDLTAIEGIGPKTAAVLVAMGITRYQTLAAANPVDLKLVLRSAGLNFGDPTTWPEQARLAAAGEWTALKSYQDTLKGGRPPAA
ncbi:MAG TPA: hypothetical protein PKG95_01015 [Anaerolineaceae bacterium]|nr:hypothetical protein [Anaerolineaceae bacterium]